MGRKLTDKQQAFIEEYLIDLNGTQAAIRAGYSPKTANEAAARLLAKVSIQTELSRLKQKRSERVQVDADYVLQRITDIDKMDIADIVDGKGNLKAILEWPKIWRQYISGMDVAEMFQKGGGEERALIGVLKKIKWPDKLKNLELMGKHVSVLAFKEQIGHSGEVTVVQAMKEFLDDTDGSTWGLPGGE